jgi:acetyl esterase/lipase
MGLPLPACEVCFSPWTDLAGTGASIRFNDGRCATFHTETIAEFAAVYLGEQSPFNPYASPAHADLSGLPPLLLQVGSTELLLDDTRIVHNKIQATKGISSTLLANVRWACSRSARSFTASGKVHS